MFSGVNYQFWKIGMKIAIESIEQGIWNAIMNEPFILKHTINDKKVDKPWNLWIEDEKKKAQYDYGTKNNLTSALNMDEFFRVSQCNNAKDMWDELEITHEGTNDVTKARKHALIQ